MALTGTKRERGQAQSAEKALVLESVHLPHSAKGGGSRKEEGEHKRKKKWVGFVMTR